METKSESTKRLKKSANRFKEYIVDCIYNTDYNPVTLITSECKLRFLHETFVSEYGWNIERIGDCNAFREW